MQSLEHDEPAQDYNANDAAWNLRLGQYTVHTNGHYSITETELFENALPPGGIWKQRVCVLVWTRRAALDAMYSLQVDFRFIHKFTLS